MADFWMIARHILWTTHPMTVLAVGIAIGAAADFVMGHVMRRLVGCLLGHDWQVDPAANVWNRCARCGEIDDLDDNVIPHADHRASRAAAGFRDGWSRNRVSDKRAGALDDAQAALVPAADPFHQPRHASGPAQPVGPGSNTGQKSSGADHA